MYIVDILDDLELTVTISRGWVLDIQNIANYALASRSQPRKSMSWLTMKAKCSVSFQYIVLTAANEIPAHLAPLLKLSHSFWLFGQHFAYRDSLLADHQFEVDVLAYSINFLFLAQAKHASLWLR